MLRFGMGKAYHKKPRMYSHLWDIRLARRWFCKGGAMTEMSFMEFLREKEIVPERERPYYQRWVRSYLNFRAVRVIGDNSAEGFMKCLVGKYGNLQLKQARHALQLYSAFRMRCGTPLVDRVIDKQATKE